MEQLQTIIKTGQDAFSDFVTNLDTMGWIVIAAVAFVIFELIRIARAGSKSRAMHEQLQGMEQAMTDRLRRIENQTEQQAAKTGEDLQKQFKAATAVMVNELSKTVGQQPKSGESSALPMNEKIKQLYQSLLDMPGSNSGMGDLSHLLSYLHTSGFAGDMNLGALLEKQLQPKDYRKDAIIKSGGDCAQFAISLPGRSNLDPSQMLPINEITPKPLYDEYVSALDINDRPRAQELKDQLIATITDASANMRKQLIAPPKTTEFAVLYVGIEGLYAELSREPGLRQKLQRDDHVVLTGPDTLTALLTSLQMGIKTISVERKSEEVWRLLGEAGGVEALPTADQKLIES